MLTEITDICPDCFSFDYQEGGCPDCGYRVPEPIKGGPALPVRTMLLDGRYMAGRVLGIGRYGITYKAFDMLFREICAIKEYMPRDLAVRVPGSRDLRVHSESVRAVYQHGMRRFIQEATILSRLENVPAIVHVKGRFTEDQTAYLVMEYLDGQDLRQAAKEGRIGARKAIGIVTEIGKAMGVVHEKGVLHQDICPENIFLLKNGDVKLLDFGSVRQQIINECRENHVQVKLGFAPPERYFRAGEQGTYTDVYGLASTCYHILTGCMIPDLAERHQGKAYIPLIRLCPEAGQAVSDAVDRALELDYRRRTQTMEAFVAELWGRDPVLPVGPSGVCKKAEGIAPARPQKSAGIAPAQPQKSAGVAPVQPQKVVGAAPAQPQKGAGAAPVLLQKGVGAAPGQSPQSVGCICGIGGIYQGAALRLGGGDCLRVGRDSASCNLVLPDQKISRIHCEIRYDQQEHRYILYDRSTNGIFLEDGAQISQRRAVSLPAGTKIRIGTTENVFLLQ